MPYQGVAFMFMLGLGIATVALFYLMGEQRLEQPHGNSGYCGGGGDASNEHPRVNRPRPDEHPSRRRRRVSNHSNRSGQLCVICQDELDTDGQPFEELRCFHSFHIGCIDRWHRTNTQQFHQLGTCPICRQVI